MNVLQPCDDLLIQVRLSGKGGITQSTILCQILREPARFAQAGWVERAPLFHETIRSSWTKVLASTILSRQHRRKTLAFPQPSQVKKTSINRCSYDLMVTLRMLPNPCFSVKSESTKNKGGSKDFLFSLTAFENWLGLTMRTTLHWNQVERSILHIQPMHSTRSAVPDL